MDDGAQDYYVAAAAHQQRLANKLANNKPASKASKPLNPHLRRLKGDAALEARTLGRHNSTSTVKMQNTMSKPNHNATIEVIASILHGRISQGESARGRQRKPFGAQFDLACFNDPLYRTASMYYSESDSEDEFDDEDELIVEQKDENVLAGLDKLRIGSSKSTNKDGKDLSRNGSFKENNENMRINAGPAELSARARPLQEFSGSDRQDLQAAYKGAKNALPLPPVSKPTAATIREFLKNMFVTAQCSEECNIICLIYMQRLLEYSGNESALNPYNWKAATMTALLLASKVWDDLSMVNEDFSIFMPYSLDQINTWEVQFLSCLKYNVRVGASEYAKVYFELRNLAQRAGLELLPDKEVDVAQAAKLEALTSTMEKRTKQMHSYQSVPAPCSPGSPGAGDASPTKPLRRFNSDAGPRPSSCRYVID